MTDPKKQLEGFIRKFAPSDRRLIHAVRRALHKRLPAANELVYDNYNFLLLDRPEVETLIAAAIAQARVRLPAAGRGKLIIRSVSAKQRPRRKPQRAPRRRFNA